MYKRIIAFVLSAAMCLTLCSCGGDDISSDSSYSDTTGITDTAVVDRNLPGSSENTDISSDSEHKEIKFVADFDENEVFEDETARKAAEIIDPAIKNAIAMLNTIPEVDFEILDWDEVEHPTGRDSLAGDAEALKWYDFIYEKMSNMEYFHLDPDDYGGYEELFIPFFTAEVAVIEDHRKAYMCGTTWVDEDETVYPVFFMPWGWVDTPCDDKEMMHGEINLYNAVEDRIIEKMPSGLNNYQKVCYFTFVIVSKAEYDYVGYDDIDCLYYPYDALVRGETVCRGYAMALYDLCRREGISCWYCSGSVPGGDHAWTCVDTTDGIRGLDITWYDLDEEFSRYYDGDTQYMFMTEYEMEFEGYQEGVHE